MKTKILMAFVGLLGLGCSKGVAPVWSQTNPETSVEFDPLNRKFVFYSNDGRGLTAKSLVMKSSSGAEFKADDLNITERSVQNRDANVAQMVAGTAMTKAAFEGAATVIRESVPAIIAAMRPSQPAMDVTPYMAHDTGR